MAIYEFKLTNFMFPNRLKNNKANFRFIVDLRYINENDQFTTAQAVMPGLDTFWECDTGETEKLNYVRAGNASKFNLNAIDDWDELILLVKGNGIHSIRFTVMDVDREDAWDKFKKFVGNTVETAIGLFKGSITRNLPQDIANPLDDPLGGAAEDMQSLVMKKIAGGDKILFRKSVNLNKTKFQQGVEIPGSGTGIEGDYTIGFSLSRGEKVDEFVYTQ